MSPTLANIDQWLQAEFGQGGAAVAIISGGQVHFYLHGFADHAKQHPVSKQTPFEIGSVTKPLVGLVTALAVVNQQLTLETNIATLLQKPEYQQHQYSVAQLLSHQSGLPRLPANLPLEDLTDPYANYTWDDLTTALQHVQPGEQQFEYSNFGYGLLAELVSQQQGLSFAMLMQQQLFSPLGMADSTVAITEGSYTGRAHGYQLDGSESANWHFRALAGAGAILSSIDDMASLILHYLNATAMADTNVSNASPMVKAMRISISPVTNTNDIGFGWILQPEGMVWHNGQTGGFNSFVGFTPAQQVGIVILANTTNPVTPGGMALLQQLRQNPSALSNQPGTKSNPDNE